MADYKLSNYNFTFPYSKDGVETGQTVMYNTRSGAMALIDEGQYAEYRDFAEEGKPVEDAGLLADLRRGGYVVDADFDELTSLRYRLLRSRYMGGHLGLTIAPTSDCNFRCIYCYEKDSIKPVTMDEETQAALIKFVEGQISTLQQLSVTWYGGEPLLAIDIVEDMSKKLMAMCDEHKVEYSAGIVTNGYLLTRENMEKLNALKVSHIQVTLDGAAEDHDKRRFLAGGRPTFDRILDNLVAIKDLIKDPISIRINADRHNIDRVDRVVQALNEKGLKDVTSPYLAMVENHNDTYNDNSCLHTNEFSAHEFSFIQRNSLNILSRIPRQVSSYCGADFNNGFVIGSDGRIFKCWNEIGIKGREIGTLKEGIKETSLLHSFLLYDATQDPECVDCKFLPVCMGGCPFMRQHNPKHRCPAMKHGLAAFMDVIPAVLEKQVDEAAAAREKAAAQPEAAAADA